MQTQNSKSTGSGYTTLFREYDPEIARWKSLDPKLKDFPSESPFSAMGNNPIMKIDPKGDVDYIYNEQGKLIGKENDWGFWDFLHKDKYFVSNGKQRMPMNSRETFEQWKATFTDKGYFNKKVWWGWERDKNGFKSRVDAALSKRESDDAFGDLVYLLSNSPEGEKMDQKHNMVSGPKYKERDASAKAFLYEFDGVLYNWREAGNIVWGAAVAKLGFSLTFATIGADAYMTLSCSKREFLENGTLPYRIYLDQLNEVKAFTRGYMKYGNPGMIDKLQELINLHIRMESDEK